MDTNVPIVANGRGDRSHGSRGHSVECRLAAVQRLTSLRDAGTVVLDLAGAIEDEYRRNLNASGQPGVGDLFFAEVLKSAFGRIERVDLPMSAGVYVDFPNDARLSKFDLDDRKFAALSRREGIPVVNATDQDWLDHRAALAANGVTVEFVCGCDPAGWFQP